MRKHRRAARFPALFYSEKHCPEGLHIAAKYGIIKCILGYCIFIYGRCPQRADIREYRRRNDDGYDKDTFAAKINLLLTHFIDMAVQGYGWIAA